jgi:hypothetical protein
MIIYRGLTVAMGGNMVVERMNPRMAALYRTLSLARPNAPRVPTSRERTVVKEATRALFRITLKKVGSLNRDK